MQFRLPLVVSNIEAPPSDIRDAGLVFERGSVEDLVQKLERVYRYKKLRQRLSSNGRKVLQAYEQDKVLGRVLELYYRVVGEQ
jgi:glycosyltransferase involved in cell wall biosynthesis